MARPLIVRSPLPGSPEAVFALLTQGQGLALWFCDACESEARLGGEVHAVWRDDDGEPWDRVGVWAEFDAPHQATLRWLDANPDGAEATPPDELKFAIAPHPLGAMLTVLSPLPQGQAAIRQEVLEEVTQRGWQECFRALSQLLNPPAK